MSILFTFIQDVHASISRTEGPISNDLTWEIKKHQMSDDTLAILREMFEREKQQDAKNFLEDLCCILSKGIDTSREFENVLVVKVNHRLVEYQEKFKFINRDSSTNMMD